MWARGIAGTVLCLTGLLWFLQGIGTAKGSPMTGHAQWSVFGVMLAAVGAVLLMGARRARVRRSGGGS